MKNNQYFMESKGNPVFFDPGSYVFFSIVVVFQPLEGAQ